MGTSKKQIRGYKYFLGVHTILCRGPVDEIQSLSFGSRKAWEGSVTSSETIYIDKPELYGGEDKEGGVQGNIDIMMGEPSQVANPYLLSKISGLLPAFRGVVSAVFNSFYMGCSNPYPKPPEWRVKRIPAKSWLAYWSDIDGSANPAHILYEIITHADWGMGYSGTDIDTDSFELAAETLFDEGFGLNFIVSSGDDFNSFIGMIMEHINAVFYVSASTGKFVLKLLREGEESVGNYDESNCNLEAYERPNYGELINEISVVFRPRGRTSDDSVTVQNLAMIQTQGIVNQTITYVGIDNSELALKVASRDLKTRSTPLARVKFKTNRASWNKNIGDVITFSWESLGIESMKLRILNINHGTYENSEISIDLVEDIFGLSNTTYISSQPDVWVDPVQLAPLATNFFLMEGTYWDIARFSSRADLSFIEPEDCYLSGFTAQQSAACLNWELWDASHKIDAGGFTPFALIDGCTETQTSLHFTNLKGKLNGIVEIGSYALIGQELVRVDAFSESAGELTLGRGCLDTVPKSHSDEEFIYFIDGRKVYNNSEYLLGENVTAYSRIRTGSDLGGFNLSPPDIDMIGRFNMPYAPGNLKVNSGSYVPYFFGETAISWAHRNRLLQLATVTDHTEFDVTPEEHIHYVVSIKGETGDEIRSEEIYESSPGVIDNSFTYTSAMELSDLEDSGELLVNYPRREVKNVPEDTSWGNVISYCRFENTQDSIFYVTDEKQQLNGSGRTNTVGWRLHDCELDTRHWSGNTSLYLDGSVGWAESPYGHLTDVDQDYTLEMKIYIPGTITTDTPLFTIDGTGLGFYIKGSNKKFLCNGATVTEHPTYIAFSNQWMTLAVTRRDSGTTILFVDGLEHWRSTDSDFLFDLVRNIQLGRVDFGAGFVYGGLYIDEFRWTAESRYSDNYIPQVTTFDNGVRSDQLWASTSLHTQFLGEATTSDFIDRTGLNILTATDVAINDYITTPSTLCEYAEFNGTSSHIVVSGGLTSLEFGLNDFTIEFHAKATGSGSGVIIDCDATEPWQVAQVSGKIAFINSSGTVLTSTSNLSTSTFDHIAISSTVGVVKLFVNGAVEDTASDSTNYTGISDFVIGSDVSIANFYNGSLSMLRVINGVSVYTSSFTSPFYSYPVGYYDQWLLEEYTLPRLNDVLTVTVTTVRDDLGEMVESFQSPTWNPERYGYGFHYGKYYGNP